MSPSNVIGIYAYGNFGAKAGSDPKTQAADYKTWLDAIGNAGFNTLVMSTFHVDAEGNLNDSAPVAANGVFNPNEKSDPKNALNPHLPKLLAEFKSNFNAKVYYSIGNWSGSAEDIANVEALLAGYSCDSGMSNPSSEYQNFVANLQVLSSALHIDGIDFDFEPHGEDPYNATQQAMVSQFICLLHSLDFGVTFAPYPYDEERNKQWIDVSQEFWLAAQANACDPDNTGTGTSKVDWWNLQCYGGGVGATANGWTTAVDDYIKKNGNRLGIAEAGTFVIPGYSSSTSTSSEVESAISEAVSGNPSASGGGWIWQLGQFDLSSSTLENDLAAYANAIKSGLGNGG